MLKFRTSSFTATTDFDSEYRKLRLGTEILVCTPGRLFELLQKKVIFLDSLSFMVLDEADVLLQDETYPLQPIGMACNNKTNNNVVTQFIFASATLPPHIVKELLEEFPDLQTIYGPGLHRIAPTVEELLIDCSGKRVSKGVDSKITMLKTGKRSYQQVLENKKEALLNAVLQFKSANECDCDRTIIFCNTIEQCRIVENTLARYDRQGKYWQLLPNHGAIESKQRDNNMNEFCKPLLKRPVILISTDRASRGMDFDEAIVS